MKPSTAETVALLARALRDWRSCRAYRANNGSYRLHPIVTVCGVPTIGHGPSTRAPWTDAAKAWFGEDSGRLHVAARLAYPEEPTTPFERLHAMDPVRTRLLHEIAAEESPS